MDNTDYTFINHRLILSYCIQESCYIFTFLIQIIHIVYYVAFFCKG